MEKPQEVIRYEGLPAVSANFNWSVGFQMERFLKALAEKKFLASKCPECGYVYAPPRNRCGKCYAQIGEKDLIELSGKGKLLSWTIAHLELDGKGNWVDLKAPKIIGAIKLEGADSTLFMELGEAKAEDLKIGAEVEIVWSDERMPNWKAIRFFRISK